MAELARQQKRARSGRVATKAVVQRHRRDLCDFLQMELGCIEIRQYPSKGILHHFRRVFGHASILRLYWPICNGGSNVFDDPRHALAVKAMPFTKACDLSARRTAAFALNVEVVFATRARRVSEVERRRQAPLAHRPHEVGMLARVVIAIAGEYVEDHPLECGDDVICPPRDGARRAQEKIVT